MGDLKDWVIFMIKNKKFVLFSSFFRHKYSPTVQIKRQIGDFKFEIKEPIIKIDGKKIADSISKEMDSRNRLRGITR